MQRGFLWNRNTLIMTDFRTLRAAKHSGMTTQGGLSACPSREVAAR